MGTVQTMLILVIFNCPPTCIQIFRPPHRKLSKNTVLKLKGMMEPDKWAPAGREGEGERA